MTGTETTVTTGYFDANAQDYDYINLKVLNLGQEPASYISSGAFNNSCYSTTGLSSLLESAHEESRALYTKLQTVLDAYQQKQLHLVTTEAEMTPQVKRIKVE